MICHIDGGLKTKIEKGEYVDLEKLLQKKGAGPFLSGNDFEHLEWVRGDNGTYLVPAKKQSKINSFRRWEQAFRVYATIYCGANPTRAKEIWQYISVINTAANVYVWGNVYSYDVIFCQLMQFNPGRSWSITYNHMWNLSMRDPLPSNSKMGRFNNSNANLGWTGQGNKGNGGGTPRGVRRKTDYCWNFNKGIKCRYGSKCKFTERCSYCDSASHGVHACHKLDKKDKKSK